MGEGAAAEHESAMSCALCYNQAEPTIEKTHTGLLRMKNENFLLVVGKAFEDYLTAAIDIAAFLLAGAVPAWGRMGTTSFAMGLRLLFLETVRVNDAVPSPLIGTQALFAIVDRFERAEMDTHPVEYAKTRELRCSFWTGRNSKRPKSPLRHLLARPMTLPGPHYR